MAAPPPVAPKARASTPLTPIHPFLKRMQETTADDIHGMRSSAGILTENGGMTSHAAVVARGMGKGCVTGKRLG